MSIPAKTVQLPTANTIEDVLIKGDLSKLSEQQRTEYYMRVCQSIGLNPMTRPFSYLTLNGKLVLYATRDCAEQLRKLNGISIKIVSQDKTDGLLSIHVHAKDKDGREDEDLGVVSFPDTLKGEAAANMTLKAVTKAKRRVTLSISGLGFLDETEVEDIPAAAKQIVPQEKVITDIQGKQITDILTKHPSIEVNKFLALAGAESVSDIMAVKFDAAMQWLETQAKKKGAQMSIEVFNVEQGSPEWFACRVGIPTGSCFSHVLAKGRGGEESKTRRGYLYRLADEAVYGEAEVEGFSNENMERGKAWEAEARSIYALDHDVLPEQVGFIKNHTLNAGCSPDSLIERTGMLEIKTMFPRLWLPHLIAKTSPPEFTPQVQGGLLVAGREWCDLMIYWPRRPPYIKRIFRDEAYIVQLTKALEVFNAELAVIIGQLKADKVAA